MEQAGTGLRAGTPYGTRKGEVYTPQYTVLENITGE